MKKALLILAAFGLFLTATAQKNAPAALSKSEELNRAYCKGLFRTADGIYFDMMDPSAAAGSAAFFNILDWLQGRVPGLTLAAYDGQVRVPYLRNSRASVFLNEMPISPSTLTSIPVTDIAMVKVIRGPFLGGVGSASGGAIAIYTIGTEDWEE